MELKDKNIAILGAGNLGLAISDGLLASGLLDKNKLIITRRKLDGIEQYASDKISISTDNVMAASTADIIIIAVQPQQLESLASEIRDVVENKLIISTITGVKLENLVNLFSAGNTVVRAMPNTALAVKQSMTCISVSDANDQTKLVENIFSVLGKTIIINDDLMQAATVLGASGIAFWMRLIRATTQGGIQMGFDAPEAQKIAVQTCLGAASILDSGTHVHPESEIDKVTTPKGCTISGLNEMEHKGLSSALIHGLIQSFNKINEL